MSDARAFAPATARNRDVILEVLQRHLPATGHVLEFASGTGEHVCHFAGALRALDFQPSDPDPAARASIEAWRVHSGLPNVRPPLALSADGAPWTWPAELEPLAAILNINMIHISPEAACEGLIARAGEALAPGAVLYLYGPYKRGGAHTSESNARFDASLRARDARWGVRDLEWVLGLADAAGFALREVVPMPANNLSVVFERRDAAKG